MKPNSQLRREAEKVNNLLKTDAERLNLGTRKGKERLDRARQSDDNVTFSYWARLEFLEYSRRQLEKHSMLMASTLAAEGARMLGISLITAKRYLQELSAGKTAPLMHFGDNILINYNYVPAEQDTYWTDEENATEEE